LREFLIPEDRSVVVLKFHYHHIPAETAVDSVLEAVPVADPEVGDAIGLEQ
jgi:hypothetical protein